MTTSTSAHDLYKSLLLRSPSMVRDHSVTKRDVRRRDRRFRLETLSALHAKQASEDETASKEFHGMLTKENRLIPFLDWLVGEINGRVIGYDDDDTDEYGQVVLRSLGCLLSNRTSVVEIERATNDAVRKKVMTSLSDLITTSRSRYVCILAIWCVSEQRWSEIDDATFRCLTESLSQSLSNRWSSLCVTYEAMRALKCLATNSLEATCKNATPERRAMLAKVLMSVVPLIISDASKIRRRAVETLDTAIRGPHFTLSSLSSYFVKYMYRGGEDTTIGVLLKEMVSHLNGTSAGASDMPVDHVLRSWGVLVVLLAGSGHLRRQANAFLAVAKEALKFTASRVRIVFFREAWARFVCAFALGAQKENRSKRRAGLISKRSELKILVKPIAHVLTLSDASPLVRRTACDTLDLLVRVSSIDTVLFDVVLKPILPVLLCDEDDTMRDVANNLVRFVIRRSDHIVDEACPHGERAQAAAKRRRTDDGPDAGASYVLRIVRSKCLVPVVETSTADNDRTVMFQNLSALSSLTVEAMRNLLIRMFLDASQSCRTILTRRVRRRGANAQFIRRVTRCLSTSWATWLDRCNISPSATEAVFLYVVDALTRNVESVPLSPPLLLTFVECVAVRVSSPLIVLKHAAALLKASSQGWREFDDDDDGVWSEERSTIPTVLFAYLKKAPNVSSTRDVLSSIISSHGLRDCTYARRAFKKHFSSGRETQRTDRTPRQRAIARRQRRQVLPLDMDNSQAMPEWQVCEETSQCRGD